jgi:undecaprenyl pyrophosphate phosphatase UppP
MKIFKKSLAAVAGASFLLAQPAAAAGAARTAADLSDAEGQLEGVSVGLIIGAILAFVVILELTGAIDIIGEDDPRSP